MIVYQLSEEMSFPDPQYCEYDDSGLLAVGGDLSTERLILAYSYGIFPWFPFRSDVIQWFCPKQRYVIFPHKIHISHSMRTFIKKDEYDFTFNNSFEEVIRNCSTVNNRIADERAWLGEDIIEAYTKLHKKGYAHSVEIVRNSDKKLVGGLFGIGVGKCFCGESMFSLEPNTSKYALIALSWMSPIYGIKIIDCQIENPYLKSMGGEYIEYEEYMKYIRGEI